MPSTLAGAALVGLVLLPALWWLLWRPRALPGVARPPDGAARPLLLGHRGTRGARPENTLAAFRHALDAGLDGIEFDVQRAADGVPVVTHDGEVDGMPVASLGSAELRRRIPGLPTLDEVLALSSAYPGRLLNLEIKAVGWRTRGLERAVARAVRASGLADRTLVSSFHPLALARLRWAAPGLRTALLFAPEQPAWLRTAALAPLLHVDALHPQHGLVTPALMRRARARRLMVNTWTVNDPDAVRRVCEAGVDGIMADDPVALRRAAAASPRAPGG